MCFGKSKKRKGQKKTKEKIPAKDPHVLAQDCNSTESEPVIVKPRPKLVSLTVTGAKHVAGDTYWALRDVASAQVRAVTEPDDASAWAQLNWDGQSTLSSDKRDAGVSLSAVKNFTVTASLDDVTLSKTIEVYDLVLLNCVLPNVLGKWKAYKSDTTTRLKAVTNPDEQKVWNLLTWSEGAPSGSKNECDVDLKPVGDRPVSVNLDTKKREVQLHICQWPKLKIKEVQFDSHPVHNDGAGKTAQIFDKKWIRGRPDPATNLAASASQSPVCFTGGKQVKLSAKFEVIEKATDDEMVKVEAALGFGKVTGTVNVKAGMDEASLPLTVSSAVLPKTVDVASAWNIAWTAIDYDGTTWLDADTSTHLRYVLLRDPLTAKGAPYKIYFTLLDISCDAAKGKTQPDELVEETFKRFAGAKGNNKGFERKGDGVRMSYYNKGSSTATGDAVQTTDGMLNSADGTGRCGGWATLLRHMWAMHGVASAQRWYIRAIDPDLLVFDLRFLVKKCKFASTGSLKDSAYTHDGRRSKKEVEKEDGLPGHGQDNPQFDFGDHVVVTYKAKLSDPPKLYDPSYGVGPYTSDDLYFADALDGLGKWPKVPFQFKSLAQHIPKQCIPYKDGFAEYAIVLNPFDFFAKDKNVDPATLFPDCEFYAPPDFTTKLALTDASQVKPGQLMVISKYGVEVVMSPLLTLADIAARHSTTEDKIFDDPANRALKSLRKDKSKLQSRDLVVVPRSLDANCWLVVGHDQS